MRGAEDRHSRVEMNVFSEPVTVDDAPKGFGQGSHAIQINDFFTQTAPKAYLTMTDMKLAMTFDFQAKEKEDGYQYFQVLVDDETNYDSGNENGDVGTLEHAQLLAGFGHDPGKKNTHYAKYSFPVPGITDFPLANYDNRWKDYGNTVGRLYSQKIKPGYLHEPSGRVMADPSLQKISVRFDASGKNDDTWYVNDLNVHIQAIASPMNMFAAISTSSPQRMAQNIAAMDIELTQSERDYLDLTTDSVD